MDSKSHRKLTFCCYHSLIWCGSSNMPLLMNQTRSISVSWLVQNRQNYLVVCAACALSTPPQAALHKSCPHGGCRDALANHQYKLFCISYTLKATVNVLATQHRPPISHSWTSDFICRSQRQLRYCFFPKCSLNSYISPKHIYMSNIRTCNLNLLA